MSIFLDNSTYNSEGFVTCFSYADALPGVATITNLMILILKPAFPHYSVESTSLEDHRFELYVQEKSLCKTIVLLVPGLGQIAVILYKILAFFVDCIKSALGYSEAPPPPTPNPQLQKNEEQNSPKPLPDEEETPEEPLTPLPKKITKKEMTHDDFAPPLSGNKTFLEDIDLLPSDKFTGAVSVASTEEFLTKVKTLEPFVCEVWKKQEGDQEESYCLGIQLTGRVIRRTYEYKKEYAYLIIPAETQEEIVKLHQEMILSTEGIDEFRERREAIEKIAKMKEFAIQIFSETITPRTNNNSASVFNRSRTLSSKRATNQNQDYENYKKELVDNHTGIGRHSIDDESIEELKRLSTAKASYSEGQQEIASLKLALKLVFPFDKEKKQYGILINKSSSIERIGSDTTARIEPKKSFAPLSDNLIIGLLNKVHEAKTLVQLHENYILLIRQLNLNNAFPTGHTEIKELWQNFIGKIIKDPDLRNKGLRQRLEYIDACWEINFKIEEA